ncbi:MAG: ORF6N domain-containing protein [Bacteroidota bacterium]|jgi:hypothetical protein
MQPAKKTLVTKILNVRGYQVMLDTDLAAIYKVDVKIFNQAVKRNKKRFPPSFCFQLTKKEWENLRSQFVTSSLNHGGRRYLPYVCTEQGVAMLSAILKSSVAITVSIQIMNAFVLMRKSISQYDGINQRLESIELKQLQSENKISKIFKALEKSNTINQGIFFDGQLFDAHVFVSDLIRKAKKSIVVIDNYVDETTLLLLSKRNKKVSCEIHTRLTLSLRSDLEKHNAQYPEIILFFNKLSHDRFLIIDDKLVFHFGASLKDLGKKCFAFSRMDSFLLELKSNVINRSKAS